MPLVQKRKMVGFWTSNDLDNYLTLVAISENSNKTVLLDKIVGNWMRERRKKQPPEVVLSKIKSCIVNSWKAEKTKGKNFDDFLAQTKLYLKKKGLTNFQINFVTTIPNDQN